jgi:integrase/recombinase XerD
MSDQAVAVDRGGGARAIKRCIDSYVETLIRSGYRELVIRQKRATVTQFACWLGKRRVQLCRIDEATVDAFLAHWSRRGFQVRNRRYTLLTFLGHLRQAGVTIRPEPAPSAAADAARLLLRPYETYLREEQGLTAETVANYLRFVQPLARDCLPVDGSDNATAGLDAQHIRDFLLRSTRGFRPTTAQLAATALRSFLRFLFVRGETAVDLSVAIPSVRRWRKATVHPFLRSDQVEQLLRACNTTTTRGRRDQAVLLLLARLGLRAREVATMQLEDLRWRTGEILVRGKGRAQQCLPLLPDVGATIAAYLRDRSPDSPCRNVFLRNEAPRVALGADAIGLIVRRALHRAGLRPSQRGSHLLRHSLATRMIRHGASMTEIGEVLRHRLPETTELYAKVDFEGLRAIALPWPAAGGAR